MFYNNVNLVRKNVLNKNFFPNIKLITFAIINILLLSVKNKIKLPIAKKYLFSNSLCKKRKISPYRLYNTE